MEKEKWIDSILRATDHINQCAPNDHLLSKIKRRIGDEQKAMRKAAWLVAASIAILIVINLGAIKKFTSAGNERAALETTFNQSNQLY